MRCDLIGNGIHTDNQLYYICESLTRQCGMVQVNGSDTGCQSGYGSGDP